MNIKFNKIVYLWLWAGLIMILFQIALGGITRLTGSGLSITKWEIVTGTMYPYNDKMWMEEYNLYKQTPQFKKINSDFNLSDFKWIYFWEYIHRLWARVMGFVFIIPFTVFYWRGWIGRPLLIKLCIVLILAVVVASLGWIMVASGLINRPWVNAYKLSFHLSAACLLIGFLYFVILGYKNEFYKVVKKNIFKQYFIFLLTLIFFQIAAGGVVAGMKASLVAPTWPDLNGSYWLNSSWDILRTYVFADYESNSFGPIYVQWVHRNLAYFILLLTLVFIYFVLKERNKELSRDYWIYVVLMFIQAALGIFTVIYSIGEIPLFYAVVHQLNGFLVFLVMLRLGFKSSRASL